MTLKTLLTTVVLLLLAVPAWAAYTTAVVAPNGIERRDDGTVSAIVVLFTGAGERPVTISYLVGTRSAADEGVALRQWRDQQLTILNNRDAFARLPALQPGQNIPAAPAPAVTPPPTAAQVWAAKVGRLILLQSLKAAMAAQIPTVTSASLNTEIAALAADVGATHQAGFGAQF